MRWLCAIFIYWLTATAQAQALQDELAPFEALVGHTYRGEFTPDKEGNVAIDISRWDVILNGRGIRISHSLNDGEYAGESLIYWDSKRQTIAFFYLTNAGFHTQGTGHFEDGVFIANESVTGNSEGITNVISRTSFTINGEMTVESFYLKGEEKWQGSKVIYQRDDGATLRY